MGPGLHKTFHVASSLHPGHSESQRNHIHNLAMERIEKENIAITWLLDNKFIFKILIGLVKYDTKIPKTYLAVVELKIERVSFWWPTHFWEHHTICSLFVLHL